MKDACETKTFPPEELEFAGMEVRQAIETFRVQLSVMIQTTTILIVANVTLVGYAVANQVSGLFFVGSLIVIVTFYVMGQAFGIMVPVVYTAVVLERKYGGSGSDWLASTFLLHLTSKTFEDELIAISEIRDRQEKIQRLRNLQLPSLVSARGFIPIVLLTVAVIQMILPFVLTYVLNWRMF